jgi:hypothetical protein
VVKFHSRAPVVDPTATTNRPFVPKYTNPDDEMAGDDSMKSPAAYAIRWISEGPTGPRRGDNPVCCAFLPNCPQTCAKGVGDAVMEGVLVTVRVAVTLGVGVRDDVGVTVTVEVGVLVSVADGVTVRVPDGVGENVGVTEYVGEYDGDGVTEYVDEYVAE